MLAKIDGDTASNSHRKTLQETIRREFSDSVEIIQWPEALPDKDGHEYDTERSAYATAQKWLANNHCDFLIAGREKGKNANGETILSMQFIVTDARNREAKAYKLTDTLDLPVKFVADFGAVIAARVTMGAAPAVHMSGLYLVPLMRGAAERMKPIIDRLNPAFDADARGSLLHSYALVCGTIGDQAGSNDDLAAAIHAFREALKEWTRERVPRQWAMTQNNLGVTLQTLGEFESGTARLHEAVTAFRDALKEYSRERAPLDWAMVQNNLGTALMRLGEREDEAALLEEAVTAFREALKEYTRERAPLHWATVQNNLGVALKTLGDGEHGTARLEEAVAAHREALKERTRERAPLDWATTQNNLGTVLQALGEGEREIARLEEAVAAYHLALKERARERVPLQWATTQHNLGTTLQTLGAREDVTARLEEAVAAYHDALKERTRERVPLDWAMSTGNQGVALMRLAERRSNLEMAQRALEQIEIAFTTTRDGGHAPNAAFYEAQLPKARALIAKLKKP
jgi:tetratricopeptide (TPR) repeat protein